MVHLAPIDRRGTARRLAHFPPLQGIASESVRMATRRAGPVFSHLTGGGR